jgi:hypothetical protein
VNTYKETPLSERTGPDFPNQMLPFCKKREICLVTGRELLNIYLAFKAGALTLEQIIALLFNTTGVLETKLSLIQDRKEE